MPGSFFDGVDSLLAQVGEGDLEVNNKVDQVYAKYQELRDDLVHPRGGQAHYARDGLIEHVDAYMERLAHSAITEDGSDLIGGAIAVGIRLKDETAAKTPREFVNLARSGHVTVTDDGAVVYDRPPDVPRLSEEQLRAQRRHGHGLDFGKDTNPRL